MFLCIKKLRANYTVMEYSLFPNKTKLYHLYILHQLSSCIINADNDSFHENGYSK